MNLEQTLTYTSKTIKSFNDQFQTNISIQLSTIPNSHKRLKYRGQQEVLSRKTIKQLTRALEIVAQKGNTYLYVCILASGLDNGYPKDKKIIASIFNTSVLYIQSILNEIKVLLHEKQTYLDPSITPYVTQIEDKQEDSTIES